MVRLGRLSVACACVIACGSANDDGLFGPPNPIASNGGAPSAGGAASGGDASSGGTATGGAPEESGGAPPGTGGGASSGGAAGLGGAGGLSPIGQGGTPEKSSPGVISCSGIPCRSDTVPANTCCYGRPGLVQTFCRPEVVACALYGASSLYCDDAADCGGGALCCGSVASALPTASCRSECNDEGSTVQLCRTSAECANERRCKPWVEFPEYSACQ